MMKHLMVLLLLCTTLLPAFSQSKNKELIKHIRRNLTDCDYFEVTDEMFKLIAEDERFQGAEQIKYIKQIEYLIFVECQDSRTNFFSNVSNFNYSDFKVLMRSRSSDERFTFYRKKNGDMFEYLLIHDGGLSYLITSLSISTLDELSGIMNMAGSIGRG